MMVMSKRTQSVRVECLAYAPLADHTSAGSALQRNEAFYIDLSRWSHSFSFA